MPITFRNILHMRTWALLLLAAIGMQAAEPIRAPLERGRGSAFSSATLDVAVVSSRHTRSEVAAAQPSLPPPLQSSAPTPEARHAAPADPAPLKPDVRGPPPRSHPARLPDSTAPPFA